MVFFVKIKFNKKTKYYPAIVLDGSSGELQLLGSKKTIFKNLDDIYTVKRIPAFCPIGIRGCESSADTVENLVK